MSITENDQALDAIHEVGPGGTIWVAPILKRILKKHSGVLRCSIINLLKRVEEEGAKDSMNLAAFRVEQMLANYQKPTLSLIFRSFGCIYCE